ncbi:hypothetical protein M419DRAFT_7402 [Trichoderma reesei RUT C-30]|jgi:hypothetical protein|uniref:Uncharacterized protein n=1 Tax=Hypocrea jecorina (strain ATCC 56765 / BCRC 32924 / NRRL 11460 / Rut C-30) TaxID=1344414 RepID=A0A024SH22_HYPJR|nr:hypothetical protein M419DRAFT_7402 [Trichoderma reesei RUT C-30]
MDEPDLDLRGFLLQLRQFPDDVQRLVIIMIEDVEDLILIALAQPPDEEIFWEDEDPDEATNHHLRDGADAWGFPQDHRARATGRCLYLYPHQPPPRGSAP